MRIVNITVITLIFIRNRSNGFKQKLKTNGGHNWDRKMPKLCTEKPSSDSNLFGCEETPDIKNSETLANLIKTSNSEADIYSRRPLDSEVAWIEAPKTPISASYFLLHNLFGLDNPESQLIRMNQELDTIDRRMLKKSDLDLKEFGVIFDARRGRFLSAESVSTLVTEEFDLENTRGKGSLILTSYSPLQKILRSLLGLTNIESLLIQMNQKLDTIDRTILKKIDLEELVDIFNAKRGRFLSAESVSTLVTEEFDYIGDLENTTAESSLKSTSYSPLPKFLRSLLGLNNIKSLLVEINQKLDTINRTMLKETDLEELGDIFNAKWVKFLSAEAISKFVTEESDYIPELENTTSPTIPPSQH